MADNMINLVCPSCGATLDIEEGRIKAFCSYCGSQVIIPEASNEFTIHNIDEAELRRVENERVIQLRRLDIARERREEQKKRRRNKTIISLILLLAAILCFASPAFLGQKNNLYMALAGMILINAALLVWIMNSKEEEEEGFGDAIPFPDSIRDYHYKTYPAVAEVLRNVGFKNVRVIPLADMAVNNPRRVNRVQSITVNGKEVVPGKSYYQDDKVVVTYHSLI